MSNINVVIADDNERIRQNLQEIVSRECDMTLVGSASDGMDALSMIRTSHPDVVLLDIIMPKMDGLGVLEEVKKDEKAIIDLSENLNVPFRVLSVEEISQVDYLFEKSEWVKKSVGVYSVAEPCAHLLSDGNLIIEKQKYTGITFSAGRVNK